MRSRLAITAMLIMGFALSTTGVGLAVSGTSGSGSAGNAQYQQTTPTKPPADDQGGDVGGNQGQASTPTPDTTQAVQQIATTTDDGSQLPFTGLAVIPVLIAGAGLLIAGLVLRRNTKSTPDA